MNDHRLKAVASGYGLTPDWVGPGGRLANWLDHFEVVVGNLRLLVLNVFLPHLVRHIAARGNPIAPTLEMLTPIPLAKRLIFRQQFVGALFPLRYCAAQDTDRCGRIPTSICTWSRLIAPA